MDMRPARCGAESCSHQHDFGFYSVKSGTMESSALSREVLTCALKRAGRAAALKIYIIGADKPRCLGL